MPFGYATSQSWGKRSLEAKSAQDLHDSTVQATEFVRSLNSTVIVQGTQAEKHQLETRTITNHNHCHALTVQYYEVLRRLKLETRYLGSRPGVLIAYKSLGFNSPHPTVEERDDQMGHKYKVVLDPDRDDLHLVNRLRPLLEANLLEPRLAANFEAVRRLLFFEAAAPIAALASTPEIPSSDYEVKRINVTVLRGRWGTDTNVVSLRLQLAGLHEGDKPYATFEPPSRLSNQVMLENPGFWGDDENFEEEPKPLGPFKLTLASATRRSLLKTFEIHFDPGAGGSDFSLKGLRVAARTPDGQEDVLVDEQVDRYFQGGGIETFDVVLPKPPEPAHTNATGSDKVEDRAAQRAQDVALAWELITHLHDHRDTYGPRLVALKEPMWFAHALDQMLGLGNVRDNIDSLPVAISGQYIVFAYHGGETTGRTLPPAEQPAPTYVSLPTRGVLAEAQLGNCNACEKRDVTRFWKWEESPCEQAPAIEGVAPGFRGQPPNVDQGQLPNAVVQITQPPTAPDPVGLAAALNLLGKGDAFRDMSGMPELQQLLSGLASGAVDLVKARQLAKQVDAKQAQQDGKGASPVGGGAQPRTPEQRYDEHQVLQAQVDEGHLTPEDARRITLASWERDRSPSGNGDAGTGTLDSAEIERVKAKVEQLISAARKVGFKYAASNLEHWYRGKGEPAVMPSTPFTREQFMADHLRNKHGSRFALGAENRVKSGALKPGSSVSMTWTDSVVAPSNSELFYALGGFTVESNMIVTASEIPGDPTSLLVRVDMWTVSCSDYFEFDSGKTAFIPGFGRIEDAELDELRQVGLANNFPVKSMPFDALQLLGPIEVSVPRQ